MLSIFFSESVSTLQALKLGLDKQEQAIILCQLEKLKTN